MHKRDDQCSPFFVIGAQRSGTTMLRLMLNQHPRLVVPPESGFITVFYRKLAQYGDLRQRYNAEKLLQDIAAYHQVVQGRHIQDMEAILSFPIATYADLVRAIFAVYAQQKGKARWGDKTPFYTPDLDILWTVLPGCRIVHLVRDGRDVAVSLRAIEWGYSSIPRLAADWRWKTTIAHKVGTVLGEYYLEIRYEDLVLKTEETLHTVCNFLGEDYHPCMLQYPTTAEREVPQKSMQWHKNSMRAPDTTKVYAWKHGMSVADRIIFEQVASEALELFGYERENHISTLSSRLKSLYYATVKRW